MGLLTGLYFLIALGMCSFILLMNEDNEGMGAPSVMSPVRSSQKGSVLQQIIWVLITLFFSTCILLNRVQSGNFLVNALLQKKPQGALKLQENSRVKEKVVSDLPKGGTAHNVSKTEDLFTNITDEVLQDI